jgi:DNA-binding transcriptional MerR regulator
MKCRVEELASAAAVSVDTVRFYQGRGLIPVPERQGRVAIYGDRHLARLKKIRALLEQGFSLAQIARLVESAAGSEAPEAGASQRALLEALAEESVGTRSYTPAEFAAETGLPEALLTPVRNTGLIQPIRVEGEERFTASDVELAKVGLALLGAGLPLAELLAVASSHVRNTEELADAGIDLFDDHIRKAGAGTNDDDATAQAFRTLLPQVTRLVALHFQRTLVNRALERLGRSGDDKALELALEATESARLEVEWR